MVLKFDLSNKKMDEKIKERLLARYLANISQPICPAKKELRFFIKRILIYLAVCLVGLPCVWGLVDAKENVWVIVVGCWPFVLAFVALLLTIKAATQEEKRYEKEKRKFEEQMRFYESDLQQRKDTYIGMLETDQYFVEKTVVHSMHKVEDSDSSYADYFINRLAVPEDVYNFVKQGDLLYKCGVKGIGPKLFLLQKPTDLEKFYEITVL